MHQHVQPAPAASGSPGCPTTGPGSWMYHCHILEHHAAGMMAHFDVIP